MAKYKSIVVTNGGLALIAAAHSGDTIEFTAIKTGAGIYDGTEVLAEATALKDVKQTLGISGLTKNESVIKVNTVLTNEGVDEAYKITELGLYAKDSSGNEILYAIVVAETGMEDYLPAYADAPTTVTFELYIEANTYDKDITFQATVIAGTYATPQDVSDAVASMTSRMGTIQSSIMQEVNAGLAKKVNTADIVDNLYSTATDLPLSANQGKVLNSAIIKRASHFGFILSSGASKTLKFRYGGESSSALVLISMIYGPGGMGLYHFYYGSGQNKTTLIESNSSGAAFTVTSDDSAGMTITAGNNGKVYVTVISQTSDFSIT